MQALNASAVLCGEMGGGCTAEDGHGVAPVGHVFSLGFGGGGCFGNGVKHPCGAMC